MLRAAVRASQYSNASSSVRNRKIVSSRNKSSTMMCFQCEQARGGSGCFTAGVCGKSPETAALQDLLVHAVKGIAMYSHAANKLKAPRNPEIDKFVVDSMFATMTNVNFDSERFSDRLEQAGTFLEQAENAYKKVGGSSPEIEQTHALNPASLSLKGKSPSTFSEMARQFGLLEAKERFDPDLMGLRELILYGVKGTAAYASHADRLSPIPDTIHQGLHEALAFVGRNTAKATDGVEDMLNMALHVGKVNLDTLATLEANHINAYGTPEPYNVKTTPVEGKCILVSGHDIKEIGDLLEQTKGTGVNVYTHGEMLPAHSYPKLNKYDHFAGHWGRAWQKQRRDFGAFPGPIIITTNCLIEPDPSYEDRIFTTTVTGWPGVKHLDTNDFSSVIELAKRLPGFKETKLPEKNTLIGFGKDAILSKAGDIVEAIKAGDLKHFYVIGGCDGTEHERHYFKDLAKAAPQESIVLTMGCGKFRLNSLELGQVKGLPRLMDMGQCNDAYGAIQVALALSNVLKTDVNDLPISYAISWFEQKAVAVLLTLLHLNIKGIHLGPRIPAFCTPNIVNVLNEKFKLAGTRDYREDFADSLG